MPFYLRQALKVSGRRQFLLGLSAPLALACGPALTAGRTVRIGVLQAAPMSPKEEELLLAELKRRGWEIDRNVVLVEREGRLTDPASLDKAARELVESKVDLIYAYPGSPPAVAAVKATSTIPIVFHASSDPIGQGLIRSFARPGLNATGSFSPVFELFPKNFEVLAQTTGKLSSLAVLYFPEVLSWSRYPGMVSAAEDAGRKLGIAVRQVVFGPDVSQTLQTLVREGVDGVSFQNVTSDSDPTKWKRLADALIAARLPSIGSPRHGFLLSYGGSTSAMALAAARYIDEILRGANPAAIPVEQASTFDLDLNLRTAAALGITVPQAVLLRATTLIQ